MCSSEGLGILTERGKYAADPYGYGKEKGPITEKEYDTYFKERWAKEYPDEPYPHGDFKFKNMKDK